MENIDDLVARLAQDASVVKPAANPFVLSLKLTGAAVIYLAISFSFSGLRPDWLE
jgi:hypothetical protein